MRLKNNYFHKEISVFSLFLKGFVFRNRCLFGIYWYDSLGGDCTEVGKILLYNSFQISLSLLSILLDLKKFFHCTLFLSLASYLSLHVCAQGLGVYSPTLAPSNLATASSLCQCSLQRWCFSIYLSVCHTIKWALSTVLLWTVTQSLAQSNSSKKVY